LTGLWETDIISPDRTLNRIGAHAMGLKNDRWIREYALKYRMIEPFEERLVRKGRISYGLSSYGYDIRVADEFKIFQPEFSVRVLSDSEKGYIAALVDLYGEISADPPLLRLRLPSVELLKRIHALLGGGEVHGEVFLLQRPGDLAMLLSQILPFLFAQKERAAHLLERLPTRSLVVDPKAFDISAFVDVRGEECIIPPNSFALARSVEYFRIPRSVFGLVVGKSTYARCGIIVNITPLEPEWEGYLTLEISNTTPLPARIYAGEGIAQLVFFEADEECEVSYADRRGKYQKQMGVTLPRVES